MSISEQGGGWGPSHQYLPPPRKRKRHLLAWSIGLGFLAFELFAHRVLSDGGVGAAASTVHTMLRFALGIGLVLLLVRGLQSGWGSHIYKRRPAPFPSSPRIADAASVRAKSARLGGGAYLGLGPGGRWVTADPEHARARPPR
jgi:hypothetical protein